ncbi:hypothetical protein LMB65_05685 [Limosilactobacillus reuteri]|nr:hypothetical protein [Limosilactobacillus reuteri]
MFEGVTPSEINKENYLEVLRVMKARAREDRPLNAEDAHAKMAHLLGN